MRNVAIMLTMVMLIRGGCSTPKIGGWVKEGVEPYSETWQKDIEYCQGNQYQQIMPKDFAYLYTD